MVSNTLVWKRNSFLSGATKQATDCAMCGRDRTEIPLDTREGQLEIAEEDGDVTDSLVLPYQTTGSF